MMPLRLQPDRYTQPKSVKGIVAGSVVSAGTKSVSVMGANAVGVAMAANW